MRKHHNLPNSINPFVHFPLNQYNNKWIVIQGYGFTSFNDTNWEYFEDTIHNADAVDFRNDSYGNLWICQYGLLEYNPYGILGINSNISQLPKNFVLFQNYPNPFNPSTKIKYRIINSGFVTLKDFDITGKEVSILVNESQDIGEYEVSFNGDNLPSSIYFLKFDFDDVSITKKMILIK